MYASVTTGHTAREIRNTRYLGFGEERQTVRVRPGRSNARRTAIRDSLAATR